MAQKISKYRYVPVRPETKAALDAIGRKGQTYDELVAELIKQWRAMN